MLMQTNQVLDIHNRPNKVRSFRIELGMLIMLSTSPPLLCITSTTGLGVNRNSLAVSSNDSFQNTVLCDTAFAACLTVALPVS
jgi:hypothetical protein